MLCLWNFLIQKGKTNTNGKRKEITECFSYKFWKLTERTVPCPVPSLRACAGWSRPSSRPSRRKCRMSGTIICPMPFLSTFETGRTSSCGEAFVVCITCIIMDIRTSDWKTSWHSMLIAPLEETTRTSLYNKETNNQAMAYAHITGKVSFDFLLVGGRRRQKTKKTKHWHQRTCVFIR